jgi:hypothetical protein
MFGSFNAWRSHEMDHRREWFCLLCNLLHHDKTKAMLHLMHDHGQLAEHQIDMLLRTSSRPSEHLPADDCPFCDWGIILRERNHTPQEHDLRIPSRRFMKHLGRHLEEIALFVVPQAEEERGCPGDDEIASNAVEAVLDEESEIASTPSSFKSRPRFGASVLAEYGEEILSDELHQGLYPCPVCGGHFEDLQEHTLTHAGPSETHPKVPDTVARHGEYVCRSPRYYSLGRIFEVPWVKNFRRDTFSDLITKEDTFDQPVFQFEREARRFVVVQEQAHCCFALPILTYGGKGVGEKRVVKCDHAIVFTGQDVPFPNENELPAPGESPMRNIPIRILLDDESERLDPMSRINLREHHQLHKNIKTKNIGRVHKDSVKDLMHQYFDVFNVPTDARSKFYSPGTASDVIHDEDESGSGSQDGESDIESQEGESEDETQNDEIQNDESES